ncbi:MAG: M15 family metallopeptidase [Deltaproteobacteria bacterium]|nr:M15 family metallopeptidase [Deltaproteobacteria bacterium]
MKIFLRILIVIVTVFCSTHSYADSNFTGKITPIPEKIKKQMMGTTWKEGCPVALDQLAYLQISYWGFDDKPHIGELIVNNAIAENTVATFKELFEIRFPIESMKLRNVYYRNPGDPSEKNNSSAFNYRKDEQSPKKLSTHSYGIAIDLNPFYNPSPVAGGKVDPEGAEKYLNRKLHHKGMIHEGDTVFQIMTKHGWASGEYFHKGADPMHFEIIITRQYIIKSLEFYPNKWGFDVSL